MKEISELIFHRCFAHILNYALHYVLSFKEMSVYLAEKILIIFFQNIMFFLQYSASLCFSCTC